METVASNIFSTNLLSFLLNSNCHKISFFDAWGLKPGHFDVFNMLFTFLVFLKLQTIIL